MPSSSYCLSQIQNCEQQIRTCESDLQKEKEILDGRLNASACYKRYVSDYEEEIAMKRKQADNLSSFAGKSVFAKRYSENMKDTLWGTPYQNNMEQLYCMQKKIADEIQKTDNRINELRQRLVSLNSELQSWKSQYSEAVRREAEEAALAAQKASSGGKK